MMAPPLQYVARFDGGGGVELLGLEGGLQGDLAVVLPVCRIPVSICCAKWRATSFTRGLEGGKQRVYHFPRFRPYVFLRTERCS